VPLLSQLDILQCLKQTCVPLLSQLDIFQCLKQTLYLCCLNWTSSSISSRPEPSAISTGHPPVSQANLTSLSRVPRLASVPHTSCMLSAYFRTHFLLSDDTFFLWLSLLLIDISPISLLRRICNFTNLSFLAIYARSFYIPDKVPEPFGSFIAFITRFGDIAHARRYRLEKKIKITFDRFEHPRPLKLELA
jgi:hypothetical protein